MTDSTDDGALAEVDPGQREHVYGNPGLQFHPQNSPEVQRGIERREALRAEELEHLTELRDRVLAGMEGCELDLASGAEMLLNISKARMALAGVGYYPGAF